MSYAQPDLEQSAPIAEADPAVVRAEERLAMLRELAEIGLRLARALERRVLADDEAAQDETSQPGAAAGRDPAGAFAGLSRAIRLTLTLEAKTDEDLRALKSGVEQAREEQRRETERTTLAAAVRKRQDRQNHVHDLVMCAAGADMRDSRDWERLDRELDERLDVDEAFWIDPQRPPREIVERYCGYFGLRADWSRWTGEGWAPPGPPIWPWVAARATDPASPTRDPAPAAAHDLE